MANKDIEKHELSEQEMNDLIKLIEDESFDDDYDIDWDDRVTFINVYEDPYGCRACYGFDEDGPGHSVSAAYERHTLKVANLTLEFINYGNGEIDDIEISGESKYILPEGELLDNLKSALAVHMNNNVYLPDDGDLQFEKDWTNEEIIEVIESELTAKEFIKVDHTIYPADDWEEVVDIVFEGKEPDESSYTRMSKHEAAEELADNLDLCY